MARAYRQLGATALAARAEAAFKKRDEYDRKVRALNDEIGADPENPRLRFRLAEIHAAIGMNNLAIAAYRAGLQRDPENESARKRLVKLQEAAVLK
jgi:cytochrome c-type biogenesis protein CcmH/NrfG